MQHRAACLEVAVLRGDCHARLEGGSRDGDVEGDGGDDDVATVGVELVEGSNQLAPPGLIQVRRRAGRGIAGDRRSCVLMSQPLRATQKRVVQL